MAENSVEKVSQPTGGSHLTGGAQAQPQPPMEQSTDDKKTFQRRPQNQNQNKNQNQHQNQNQNQNLADRYGQIMVCTASCKLLIKFTLRHLKYLGYKKADDFVSGSEIAPWALAKADELGAKRDEIEDQIEKIFDKVGSRSYRNVGSRCSRENTWHSSWYEFANQIVDRDHPPINVCLRDANLVQLLYQICFLVDVLNDRFAKQDGCNCDYDFTCKNFFDGVYTFFDKFAEEVEKMPYSLKPYKPKPYIPRENRAEAPPPARSQAISVSRIYGKEDGSNQNPIDEPADEIVDDVVEVVDDVVEVSEYDMPQSNSKSETDERSQPKSDGGKKRNRKKNRKNSSLKDVTNEAPTQALGMNSPSPPPPPAPTPDPVISIDNVDEIVQTCLYTVLPDGSLKKERILLKQSDLEKIRKVPV